MYKYIMAVFPKEKCFDFFYIGDVRFRYPRMNCILVPFSKIEDVLTVGAHLTEEGYNVHPVEEGDSDLYI